ncbi:alpha/beta hydrolase [Luteimonas kalidii]|uniref:Alpha/beta fold hydrolase n=1 Tax=Luteimonas kalidii TaxID=3042025 RepID=A0ABT6JXQ1_9GAMM|nr:alpha/beta hydrolase [Luteimonas kalidii]MDH5835479.1 alpha/beta fold hydrolase [Luteimonas kalidii]
MGERIRSTLMVHGGGGGGWEWNVWKGVFEATRMRVAAPDLRASPNGLAATGLDDYAAQVRAALASLPRPRAVVGASLGGLLAMECAADADALVLVNPVPPSPWHAQLPGRDWPDVVPWQRDARLTGTRRALPDADEATALFAFRHWRDESGRAMREAYAGRAVPRPACRVLCIASMVDDDVPPALTAALATDLDASLLRATAVSHVGPLLGRNAADCAEQALAWLSRG